LLDEIAAATANAAAAAETIVAVVTPAVAAPAAPALEVVPAVPEFELACCAIAICEVLKVKTNKIIDNFLNMRSPKEMNLHKAKHLCSWKKACQQAFYPKFYHAFLFEGK